MGLSIRRFKSLSGERFALLVDEAGMPLFYPSLYVTSHMRGASRALNTILNALNAIKALYAWQEGQKIDLESRFSKGELLKSNEVHSLRDFMQQPLSREAGGKVVSIKRRVKPVSTLSQYARMSVVASYIDFLAGQLQPGSPNSSKDKDRMVAQIKANRPKTSSKSIVDRDEKHIDDAVLDAIDAVLSPGSDSNPYHNYAVQIRNALMINILRVTGLRRGELLNLRVSDIDFSRNTLSVRRRPDSINDPRVNQPLAKTRERVIPLIPELISKIYDYVMTLRNKVPGAKKHGYLFVTHKAGKTQGLPLSNPGFGRFMSKLKCAVENSKGLHAHALRHNWNYSFSKTCTGLKMTPEREEKLRSYLMGWEETSGTAAIYNRRHIKEQAAEAALDQQRKYFGGVKGGDVE